MIIGLNGQIGAGKDTVGAYLVERYGFERKSFAAKLKEATAALFDVSVEEIEAFKNEPRTIVYLKTVGMGVHGKYTVREILQRMGTEVGRDVFGENFWVDQLFPYDTDFDDDAKIVVTDCRFENEAKVIRNLDGIVICIDRGDSGAIHRSEIKLPASMIDDYIENFGTIEELYHQVDLCMKGYLVDAS